jgi:hypothetical protein
MEQELTDLVMEDFSLSVSLMENTTEEAGNSHSQFKLFGVICEEAAVGIVLQVIILLLR